MSTPDTDHDLSRSSSKFGKQLIKIFIVVVIVIFGYYVYSYLTSKNQNQILNQSSDQSLDRTREGSVSTNNSDYLTKAEMAQFIHLGSDLEQLKTQIANMNTVLNSTAAQQSSFEANLINVKNLVALAIVKLSIEKDIDSTLQLLEMAQRSLLQTTNHELQTLRKNILIKIEQLKGIKQADMVQIKAALQEYANVIDKVSVLDFVSAIKNEKAVSRQNRVPESQSNDTLWQKFVVNFKDNFFELVKIRNIKGSDVSFAKLQNEENINLIKTYFKLKTAELSIDLQQRNQNFFTVDINDLIRNTNLYFANNLDLKSKLTNLLNGIKDVNINPDLPELYSLQEEIQTLALNNKAAH